jgi:hypothetical protein
MELIFFSFFCLLGICVSAYKLIYLSYFSHRHYLADNIAEATDISDETDSPEAQMFMDFMVTYPSWLFATNCILFLFEIYAAINVSWIPFAILALVYIVIWLTKASYSKDTIKPHKFYYAISKIALISVYTYLFIQY